MSIFYLGHAWQLKDVTPTQKLVFISLADQANDSGVCWPSVATLCMRTSLSERTVRKTIGDLENKGLLKIIKRSGSSNYYDLTPALDAPLHEMHPLHQLHPTPAPAAPHPRTSCTPPLHQLHPEPKENPKRTQREPKENPKGELLRRKKKI